MKKSLEMQAMDGELDAEEYIRLTELEERAPRSRAFTDEEKAEKSRWMTAYHARKKA